MYNFVLAAILMSSVLGEAYATPTVSVSNEPRSYGDVLKNDPHPDWVKSGQVTVDAFSEVQLPNSKFVTQPNNNVTSTPCSKYFGITPETITTVNVVPTTDTVAIRFSGQFTIPEGNGFAATSLICSVTQGNITYECSGISGEPFVAARVKVSQTSPMNAWRSSALAYPGYNGFVNGLIRNEPVTVTISSRTFSIPAGFTGQVCAGSMEVAY